MPLRVAFLCSRISLGLALLAAGAATDVRAQTDQNWLSANPNNDWSLSAPNWDTGGPWMNGNNAIFAGAGETVELASDVTVNNITFNSNGYIIADANGDSLLTLGNPSTITVTTAGHTATISDALTIGAITKAGAGTLVLLGENSFSGAVSINQGRLSIGSDTALGDVTGETTVVGTAQLELRDGVVVAGEMLNLGSGGNDNFGGLRTAANASATWEGTVKLDAGARVGSLSGGTITLNGPIQNGAATVLNISATGVGSSLGVVLVSGTSNTYTGATNIVRGVLKLGATNALPTTTPLDVDSTSAAEDSVFDLNGFNQTIGSLQRSGSAAGAGGSFITNNGSTTSTLTVNQSSTSTYNGVLQDGSGVLNLTKTGAGSLTISGDNTYTGATVLAAVSNNELVIASNTALGSTAGGTAVSTGARVVLANDVKVTGETITITGTGGNNSGALQTAANATAEWAGNIIVTGNEARMGGGVGGTLIVSGVISGGSSTAVLFSRGQNATTVLNAANTYTGDTQMFANTGTGATLRMGVDNAINAGSRISVITPAIATVSMLVDLNGHVLTLRGLDTQANHTSGAVLSIANNGASPSTLTVAGTSGTSIFAGILKDGTGGLSLIKSGNSTQTLIAANTYTGSTTVNAGTLQIGGAVSTLGVNGRLASTDIIVNGGTLALDNLGANNNNSTRLSDAANLTFHGGSLVFRGSNQVSTNSSETIGSFTLGSRVSIITTAYGSTNTATVTAGEMTRGANGGIALVNGIDLGRDGTSTDSVARVVLTTSPTLVGATAALTTGINAAAQDTQIVPFLLGEAAATTGGLGTATGTPNTFVAYDATTGLRPLNPVDEFTENSFEGGHNTRLTTTTGVTASVAINSLILSGASTTISGGRTLTVDSGAILFTAGSALSISGGTLDFGSREGIITINSTTNTTISSLITGTAGVSYYGTGTLVLGTQQSTYSGDTGLYVGTVIPQSSSTGPAGAPSAGSFGTGTLILGGSNMRATTARDIAIANPVLFQADTTIIAGSTDKTLSFTGPMTLAGGTRTLTHQSAANTYLSGDINDAGQNLGLTISGSGAGSVILSGANTYTGATTVTGSTLLVNGDQSAATGAVTVSGGILGGTGTLGGATTIRSGGTLSPSDPATDGGIGTLTFASSLTLDAGSVTHLQITGATFTSLDGFGGNGPGSPGYLAYVIANGSGRGDHDHLSITGAISQATGGKINVSPVSFTPAEGQIFNLLDWGDVTGSSFSANLGDAYRDGASDSSTDLDLPDISSSGFLWDISLFADHGIIVIIPEPSRAILLMIGLASAFMRRRRC